MTIDDSLGHPWIKVRPLFLGCRSLKSTAVRQGFGEFRIMHSLISNDWLVDVGDSRSHVEIV